MPTLPLYESPADPDAWHRVTAPGGYEWWHFAAEDAATTWHTQIDFFDGDPFSGAYRRAYARFRRRPTRVAPPVPRDYPAFRSGIWGDSCGGAGAFRARVHPPAIELGRHAATWGPGGVVKVIVAGLGLGKDVSTRWSELTFRPVGLRAAELRKLDASDADGEHFFMPDREYEVSGFDATRDRDGKEARRVIVADARGHIRHYFGTAPLPPRLLDALRTRHAPKEPAASLLRK